MNLDCFDSVKTEKAKAVARYNRARKLTKLLQTLEVVVALALLSWLSGRRPAAFKFPGEFFLQLRRYFDSPHSAFIIGNAIIVTLFVLSRQNDYRNNAGDADCEPELHIENHDSPRCFSSSVSTEEESNTTPPQASEETAGGDDDDKQLVCSENVGIQAQCDTLAMAIKQAANQMRRFQRTQSEKLRREITEKPQRDLHRSETEKRLIVVTSGERRMATSSESVNSLSDEEFQVTIESFIQKQRLFLKAQKMAELGK